jgi:Spy/CpxP family protein refolding chaperone
MKKLVIFAVMLLFVTASALPQGRSKGPGKNNKSGYGMVNVLSKLNLTADQKSKIEKLRTAHQKTMIDLKADLQKKQIEKRDIVRNSNYAKADLVKQTEEMNKIRNKIALEKANFWGDVSEVLTDSQKAELKNLKPCMDGKPMNKNLRKSGRGSCNMW